MRKTTLIIFFVSALLAAGCVPAQPTLDTNLIGTAIAQTLTAVGPPTSDPGVSATQTPIPVEPSPTPQATATELPADTPTPLPLPTDTLTATPALSPDVPQVTVSVPTNCRVGPGILYDRVGGLQVGQAAEVVGRHAARDYWIIRNPARPSQTCWLWGQFATVSGNTAAIPEMTPPPVPTPTTGFTIRYDGLDRCAGTGWWMDLELENTGRTTFRSFFASVTDTVTGTQIALYENDFIDRDGCNPGFDQGDFDPGDSVVISSPVFTYDPSGHRMSATVTVCSNAGQTGTCTTQSISFTP